MNRHTENQNRNTPAIPNQIPVLLNTPFSMTPTKTNAFANSVNTVKTSANIPDTNTDVLFILSPFLLVFR